MNNETIHGRPGEFGTPGGRRFVLYLYLVLFGVLLGVFLTSYAGMVRSKRTVSGTAIQTISNTRPGGVPPANTGRILQSGTGSAKQPAFTGIPDFERAVIAAARKAIPAVVSIHVTGVQIGYRRFRDPLLDFLYGRQLRRIPVSGMGSGVIIDPKGIIITNDHVINLTEENIDLRKAAVDIRVLLTDGRAFPAKIVKNFPIQDIAILSVDAGNLPYIEIGSSGDVSPGQTVLAIGNPFGDVLTGGLLGSEATVTRGIISATHRNLAIPGDHITRYYRNMLQTDASINEGNSGGALIDLEGRLIGINTAIISPSGAGSVGIGFAFPADRIKLILERVDKHGDIGPWYTGIRIQELTRAIAASLGFDGVGGVLVTSTEKGSPGEKSGLKPGDIIVKVDNYTVTNTEELKALFNGALPGETFRLTVFRDGGYRELVLEVGTME